MTSRAVVLVVQDPQVDDVDARALHPSAVTIRTATLELGYKIARQERPDLIAINLSAQPGAWTMCRLLKADSRTADIPVVMIVPHGAPEIFAHARVAGAHVVVVQGTWSETIDLVLGADGPSLQPDEARNAA